MSLAEIDPSTISGPTQAMSSGAVTVKVAVFPRTSTVRSSVSILRMSLGSMGSKVWAMPMAGARNEAAPSSPAAAVAVAKVRNEVEDIEIS